MNFHLASRRPRHTKARAQAGFTLVELITVILILGVLSAVALPRYADLQGKARAAKVNGVLGSMKAAAALVKATGMVSGTACAATGTATLEGTAIATNWCYPQALNSFTDGILGAANVLSTDNWTTPTTGAAAGGSNILLQLSDATTPGTTCQISYTSPAALNAAPSIVATTSGC